MFSARFMEATNQRHVTDKSKIVSKESNHTTTVNHKDCKRGRKKETTRKQVTQWK
jgi:hypothetical protein